MDDVLHAVDLDRRLVGLHGGDLAAERGTSILGACTRRVAQKIRGNHSLRKQNPHQRASYGLDSGMVKDFNTMGDGL